MKCERVVQRAATDAHPLASPTTLLVAMYRTYLTYPSTTDVHIFIPKLLCLFMILLKTQVRFTSSHFHRLRLLGKIIGLTTISQFWSFPDDACFVELGET